MDGEVRSWMPPSDEELSVLRELARSMMPTRLDSPPMTFDVAVNREKRLMELPKDKRGVYCEVGDTVFVPDAEGRKGVKECVPYEVRGYYKGLDGNWYLVCLGADDFLPADKCIHVEVNSG